MQHNNIQNSNKKNNTNNIGNNYANHSSKNDDNTFSQLKELQTLYKKESALKELFIQTSNKIKTNISQYSIDIYKKKLDVLNVLNKIYSKNFDQEKKKICFIRRQIIFRKFE
jgi:hypothetical protein